MSEFAPSSILPADASKGTKCSAATDSRHVAGIAGAICAAFCCAGLPAAAILLSRLGLSFLHNDWLLVPVETLCFTLATRGFIQNRQRHGKVGPLVTASSGLILLLTGMLSSGFPSGLCLAVGACMLSLALIWDRRARAQTFRSYTC